MKKQQLIFILAIVFILALFASFRFFKNKSKDFASAEEPSSSASSAVQNSENNQDTASPIFSKREPAKNSPPTENLKDFLIKSDPKANWFVNRSPEGRVTAISGGLIHEDVSSPEKALNFAQKVAGLLDLDPQDMINHPNPLPATADTHSYRFEQTYQGYKVWGSELTVFVRNQDQSIYYILNETKPIKDVDLRVKHDLKSAQEVLESYLSGSKFQIQKSEPDPVVLATSPERGELCWQFQVQFARPEIKKQIYFISASDLRIVQSVDLVTKN